MLSNNLPINMDSCLFYPLQSPSDHFSAQVNTDFVLNTLLASNLKDIDKIFKEFSHTRQSYYLAFLLLQKPKLVWVFDKFSVRSNQLLLKNRSGIYGWYCLAANKIYIGSAQDLSVRAFSHLTNSSRSNLKLQNAIKKYGLEQFVFIVFSYSNASFIVTSKDLETLENMYLSHFPKTFKYNILDTAFSSVGYVHTQQSRDLISDFRTGKPLSDSAKKKLSELFSGDSNPFYGKSHTDSTRLKLSNLHTGSGNPMFGKPKSVEFLAQQTKNKTGALNHMSKTVLLTDLLTNQVISFDSIQACADYLGCQRSYVSTLIKNNKVYKNKYKVSVKE
jgi:group I intron endonuclease